MSDRKRHIICQLQQYLSELGGQTISSDQVGSSFMDLGFDSLFLTQAAAGMKSRLGVKITFRQLLESLTSIQALAAYIDQELPAENVTPSVAVTVSQPSNPVAPTVANTPSYIVSLNSNQGIPAQGEDLGRSSTGSVLERVIQEQLRVMELQLAALRRPGASRSSVPPSQGVGSVVSLHCDAAKPAPVDTACKAAVSPQTLPATATPPGAPMVQHGPFKPIDKGTKGGLGDTQQAHLSWLTDRYVARTPKSKAYTARHRKVFADPRAVAGFKQNWKEMVYPIVATRSSEAHLWDLDGNRWVDVTMGFGVALLGHSPGFINDAIRTQLDLGVEIGPQSPLAGEVAELICEFTGMERVTFCNTGSEAVMAALRICRTVTGRNKVVVFAGAYHGTFDEVLVKGVRIDGKPKSLPIAPGVAPNLIESITVLEYGTPESLEWIRANAGTLAAVLVETVQSRHPALQPRDFLKEIREITRAAETPLIFDEVITGFRCHPGGAQAYFGIEADLATYGKIVGGGMPFGFIAGKSWLMDAFDGGQWNYEDDSFPPIGVTFFAGTFVRHPLAMAAAKAMLLHLKEKGAELQAGLARRTDRILGDLNRYFSAHEVPLHIEHFTSIWYPHFGTEVKQGSLLYYHLREKGLHIWEGRPCFLSTAHTAEDEAFIEHAFKLSVAEMQLGGFLPGSSDPELAALASRRRDEASAASPDCPPLAQSAKLAAGKPELIPLTEGQKEMWLSAQLDPESSGTWNASCVLKLTGPLQTKALEAAIQTVVGRHEALRATFQPDGASIAIAPITPTSLTHHDFSDLQSEARDHQVESILRNLGARLFNLREGPLFHFDLIKLSTEESVLVFTVNMIVCDGWSINVVLEEVSELYSASVENRSPTLRPIEPLRSYAAWLADADQQAAGESAEAFWRQQLTDLPGPVDLPTPGPRPPRRTVRGARAELHLSARLYQQIKDTCKTQGSTPFAFLFAAYQTWLQRLTGQTDLVIGVPIAGHSAKGSETLVGQCVHTLPIRARLDVSQPFSDLLKQNRSWILDAQENWNSSFGAIAQALDLPPDPSRMPLVSVLFNLDPPMSKVRFSGLGRRISSGPRIYFQYDLGINLVDEGQELLVELDYNQDLFPADWIQSWLGHFITLLESACSRPSDPLEKLSLLSPQDLERLTLSWNHTATSYPQAQRVEDLVAHAARQHPDATAVEFEGQRLSYSELETQSNRLACFLRNSQLGRGSVIGLALPRSLDMVIALLGVLKAGAAYLPLDLALPENRLTYLLENSGAAAILTIQDQMGSLPATKAKIIALDTERDAWNQDSAAAPPHSELGTEDLAYILYTSGSTGQPKGVEIEHASVVNFLRAMQREPGLEQHDAILAITTLSFDISVLELLLPLTVGAKVVLVSRATASDPDLLSKALLQSKATVLQGTPTTWRLLLNSGWAGNKNLKALVGGEALPDDLAERMLKTCGSVWNLYGPTEATVWASVFQVKESRHIALGYPIANSQLYVVDKGLRPVPLGVPGELLIGGACLARGYRQRPELTQERFLANPFIKDSQSRVYRTGDLVRRHPDGRLEFLGRQDFQVKIRGHRVELQEIEAALLHEPAVREAAVIGHESTPGSVELIAFVVLQDQSSAPESRATALRALRQRLKDVLPDYMVPSRFLHVASMPRNASGKVDRRALRPSDDAVGLTPTCRIAPRNPTEKRLAAIWSKLLKIESIGVTDNFFELGGQSLKAVALFAQIEKDFGQKLPLATLFKAPTLEALASVLGGESPALKLETSWSSLVPIQPKGTKPTLFLVHGAGGNVLLYQVLGRHLAPDYPLHGLQSQGLDAKTPPLTSLEAMAELYLKEIKAIQPEGPYFLGGYCMGGTIAYEMAQQLRAQGDEVALVAMLDTYNFALMEKNSGARAIYQKLKFHLGNFLKLRPAEMLDYAREKVRVARDGEFKNWIGGVTGKKSTDEGSETREASVQSVNDAACLAYTPKPYAGALTLFKPQVNYDYYPDPDMGWKELALGGLHHEELPVNPHAMLVEPYVQELAQRIKRIIDRSSQDTHRHTKLRDAA